MENRQIKVPNAVHQKAMTLGEEGIRWLSGLDSLITELERDWQINVDAACLEGGSEAYVAEARTKDGTEVILKIALPEMKGNSVLTNEVLALTVAEGRGYARLLKHDLCRRALLLERLGVPLKHLGYSINEQMEIICTTLKKSWIQMPSGTLLPSGTGVAEWFSAFIAELWQKLGKPSSKHAFDTALSYTRSRSAAFSPETAVLVHGDAHNSNTLQVISQNSQTQPSFKFIDPDGLIAEPAYDLGIPMREWIDELISDPVNLGRERCAFLSSLTGVEPQAIWEWGFIQCMATGLLLIQVGQVQAGSQMMQVADAWATA